MEIKILETAAAAANYVAQEILNTVVNKPDATLGVATGRTMDAIYHNFVQKAQQEKMNFSKVKAFAVDEYIGLDKGSLNSYAAYLNHHLFSHLNFSEENLYVPDVENDDCDIASKEYEENIKKAGYVDLQLLGIGLNGHVGLNEPGSAHDSRTRIVALTSSSRNSNKVLFRDESIPLTALTIGIGTILESKKCLLIATGETKAEIIKQLVEGEVSSKNPSSAIKTHKNAVLVLDKAAARLIS